MSEPPLIGQRVRLRQPLPGLPGGSTGVVSDIGAGGDMLHVDWYDPSNKPLVAAGFASAVSASLVELVDD